MSDKITQQLIDHPVATKIADIRKMAEKNSKESIIDRLKATSAELLLLQYRMRELSVLEWYDSLCDRQKKIHDFYEKHCDYFKKAAGNYNWVVLADYNIETMEMVEYNDMWYCYVSDTKHVEKITEAMTADELNGVLCTPIISMST